MTRLAEQWRRVAARAVRLAVRASAVGILSGVLIAQVGILDGARTALGDAGVLSTRGFFACLALTQTLVYALLVFSVVDAGLRQLDWACDGRPEADASDVVESGWQARFWLVAWLLVLMWLRASLSQLLASGRLPA